MTTVRSSIYCSSFIDLGEKKGAKGRNEVAGGQEIP